MRWLFVFLALAGSALAAKERIDDADFPQLANKLLIEIQKRLRDYDVDDDDSEDAKSSDGGSYGQEMDALQSPDACNFLSTEGSIIRTQDSLDKGAGFISSLDNQNTPGLTRQYCLDSCCETTECNLAVFKDKGMNHSCYLFDCGSPSVCVFTQHPGFSIHPLPARHASNKAQQMHADELQHLAQDKTTTPPTTTTTTTPAPSTTITTQPTTTTTSTTTTTTAAPDVFKPVLLFGVCKDHKDCAGSFTECLAGFCLCQDDYHAQDGMCHPRVPTSTADGHSDKQPDSDTDGKWTGEAANGSPDPVASDGADESQASAESPSAVERPAGSDSQSSAIDTPASSDSHSTDSDNHASSSDSDSDKHASSSDSHSSESDKHASSSDSHSSDSDSHSSEIENHPSDTESSSSDDRKTDADSFVVPKPKWPQEEANKDASSVDLDEHQPAVAMEPHIIDHGGLSPGGDTPLEVRVVDGNVEIDKASQEGAVGESQTVAMALSNKSAVVALALGLVVTAMLLVFVGCRLRNMRRRLRKGRPLNSNEADYLINGMYL